MAYNWRFFKTARLVQAKVETGDDVAHLSELDPKLWTALAAPVDNLRFDRRTLELLDSDGDGRVRIPEVLAAVDWLRPRLKGFDSLFAARAEGNAALALDAINPDTPEGAALAKSLRDVSAQAGRPAAESVCLSDVEAIAAAFKSTPFNGDGVIVGKSAADEATAKLIATVAAAEGVVPDRSGADGVDQTKIDAFFADAAARLAWLAAGREGAVAVLGEATCAAEAALAAVESVVDRYFTPPEDLPLVTDAPDPALPLLAGLHPLWSAALKDFSVRVMAPVFGESAAGEVTRAQWNGLKAKFAPYRAWKASEAGVAVAAIPEAELAAALEGGKAKEALDELVRRDLALAPAYDALVDVERVIRYVGNLGEFLENYVNQAALYDPARSSVYRMGSLYLAGRVCHLCFHVDAEGPHAALAAKSNCCLVYAKLSRKGAAGSRTICAVVTAGDTAPLFVGRNGVFYDRDGADWDAVVTNVVEAQVSLREAFWAPWKKIGQTIADQVKKFIGSRQDAALGGVTKTVDEVGKPPAESGNAAALAGSVAALGVGVGMMGAAFAGLVGLVAGLPVWKTALAILAILLAVSLPSVILAWFKLRARDLGAILNAGGWAMNRPLRFTVRRARLFTQIARLPCGAHAARDPYAPSIVPWLLAALVTVAVFAAWTVWKVGGVAW